MRATDDEILAIERAAFEAWEAEEIAPLGPWRLRFMHGVTNRANSVWVAPGEPPGGLAAAVAEVEAFYAARGQPAYFQLAPIADPRLDPLLAERGYERWDEVSVQVADAAHVAARAPRAGVVARCDSAPSDAWFALSGRGGRFRGAESDVYRRLLARIEPRAGFASAHVAGDAVPGAVGLTVVAPPLAGVFSMLTRPELRGRGLGDAVLVALARYAIARGARRLYLQVSADNAPACALYARAGFRELYRYHYRRRKRG